MDREQARRLAAAIKQPADPSTARLRWAVIDSVDGATVGVRIAGSTTVISGVRYLAFYAPSVDDAVAILVTGTDLIVLGALA